MATQAESESQKVFDDLIWCEVASALMAQVRQIMPISVPEAHGTLGLDLSGSLGGAGGIRGLLTLSSGYNASTGAWSTDDYYHADGSGNITMLISNSSAPTIRI